MSDQLLKFQTPDRDYAPELVATIAASLFLGDDYELAVAQALRLLDTTHRILEQHKSQRDTSTAGREPEELIPFGEAMKRVTGAIRPGRAEERLVARLVMEGHEYIDYEELKQASGSAVPVGHNPLAEPETKRRSLSQREIETALDGFREKGFTTAQVQRLRERYAEMTKRSRAKNLSKKKKVAKAKKHLAAATGTQKVRI
jgi:hypothetical protein